MKLIKHIPVICSMFVFYENIYIHIKLSKAHVEVAMCVYVFYQ